MIGLSNIQTILYLQFYPNCFVSMIDRAWEKTIRLHTAQRLGSILTSWNIAICLTIQD